MQLRTGTSALGTAVFLITVVAMTLALNVGENAHAGEYGLGFTGESWVELGHNTSIDLTEEMTVAGWVYVTSWTEAWHEFWGKGDGGSWQVRRAERGEDVVLSMRPVFQVSTGGQVWGDEPAFELPAGEWEMPLGEWVHLAATFSSSEGVSRLYANGEVVLEVTGLAGETLDGNELPITVGANNPGAGTRRRFHDGFMSDFRLYDRALPEGEIRRVLDGQEVTDGLLAHWKLDEGLGQTATDSSGADNHGEINSGAWTIVRAPDGSWLDNRRAPSLIGLTVQQAESLIKESGLSVGLISGTWGGSVTRQSPGPGQTMTFGAPIDFRLGEPVSFTPDRERMRIIVDADTANEIDDLFAIVRALIAPEFQVEGLTSAHWTGEDSLEKSQELNERILDKMGLRNEIPHPRGAEHAMPDKFTPVDSPAAQHIIERAHAGSPEDRLYVVALGACTNLASALLLDPTIEDKVVFAFIDGDYNNNRWGPGIYNWRNDIHAVQAIFESEVEYYHMPARTVSGDFVMRKSETVPRLEGRGGVWDYLAGFWETGGPFFDEGRFGERWIMWDIALIQALLRPELATWKEVGAPRVHGATDVEQFHDNPRRVTVAVDIDVDGMLADYWKAVEAVTEEDR